LRACGLIFNCRQDRQRAKARAGFPYAFKEKALDPQIKGLALPTFADRWRTGSIRWVSALCHGLPAAKCPISKFMPSTIPSLFFKAKKPLRAFRKGF